ncbi:MAG: hypothetical protein FJ388_07030 [Verrucomicrobia bacterium]|nr:hypothetical protein [Verrucomicrobiota bacterium]
MRGSKPNLWPALIVVAAVAGCLRTAVAATVAYCPFDTLDGWSIRSLGAAEATRAAEGATKQCVALTARNGTVFLSRALATNEVAGTRVTVQAMIRTENIVCGPQITSTAKLHLAVETPAGVRHFSSRLTGSDDWRSEGLTADVPADARRVLLNIGLEACSGRMLVSELTVRSNRAATRPCDLAPVANAEHSQLALAAFPKGEVRWQKIPFRILDTAASPGGDCLRLRGIGHDDWPVATAPIPIRSPVTAIYILHGALGGRPQSETPCVIWTAHLAGGFTSSLSVFEGREIGAVGETNDLENWKVAWRGAGPDGKPITFGVTKWMIYEGTPVMAISCRVYQGAAPVVLAITAVEEPPARQREVFDEETGSQ